MRRRLIFGATGLLVAVLVVPVGSTPSVAIPLPRVLGGAPAVEGEFPFMVSVGGVNLGTHICGGSLIDKDWVLTAAHCVDDLTAGDLTVLIGRTYYWGPGGEGRTVAQILLHPAYDPVTVDYDIALLKLKWSSTIAPIQLAFGSNRDLWEPGDAVQVIGWGATSPGGGGVSDLMKATVPIVSDEVMALLYGSQFQAWNMVGAGVPNGGTGICDGDSGGPLFASSALGRRQVGVASWGYCKPAGNADAYARVADARVSRWIVANVPSLANDGAIGRSGDVNDDGRDDLVVFTRGSGCDIWVTKSAGNGFGPAKKWHNLFACGEQIPLVGDFNGDQRADVAAFTRGGACDVHVAVSTASEFIGPYKWSDYFACGTEIPAVGDFNGDGRDDVATFTRGAACDVYVALSEGFTFGPATKWHDVFGCRNEIPATGDFNGDGRDDLATFTVDFGADVYVALSTGSGFVGTAWKWHEAFSFFGSVPAIGDFNADGRDDIATFTRGNYCDVYAATSTGSSFGTTTKWNDVFSCGNELPGIGDFNGDGRDDVVTFTRGSSCDVWVAGSIGVAFVGSAKWSDYFACGSEIPVGASTWW